MVTSSYFIYEVWLLIDMVKEVISDFIYKVGISRTLNPLMSDAIKN